MAKVNDQDSGLICSYIVKYAFAIIAGFANFIISYYWNERCILGTLVFGSKNTSIKLKISLYLTTLLVNMQS